MSVFCHFLKLIPQLLAAAVLDSQPEHQPENESDGFSAPFDLGERMKDLPVLRSFLQMPHLSLCSGVLCYTDKKWQEGKSRVVRKIIPACMKGLAHSISGCEENG